jgi:HPt (histidine-containing phosphotransfer) domain-containing protein
MNEPINSEELLEIMDDDIELLKECFEDFLVDSVEMLNEISEAIMTDNAEALEKSAHALKGSLKYLAAGIASDVAYELELMGSEGQLSSARSVFERLQKECHRIREYIENY